jgi:hypothetical protein
MCLKVHREHEADEENRLEEVCPSGRCTLNVGWGRLGHDRDRQRRPLLQLPHLAVPGSLIIIYRSDGDSPVSLARASSRLRSTLGLLTFGGGLGATSVSLSSRVGSGVDRGKDAAGNTGVVGDAAVGGSSRSSTTVDRFVEERLCAAYDVDVSRVEGLHLHWSAQPLPPSHAYLV